MNAHRDPAFARLVAGPSQQVRRKWTIGFATLLALEFELEVDLPCRASETHQVKRAEGALRESEATFRAMFDASSVGEIEVEPGSSRFLRANAAMCKFLGYGEEELLARTLLEITHPEDRDRSRELG